MSRDLSFYTLVDSYRAFLDCMPQLNHFGFDVCFGVVDPWVGQIVLQCNVFTLRLYSSVPLTRELDAASPLAEATADLS